MKKGFTLIELLAVIVILAIIAVIAVPIVISIINDSTSSTALRSGEFYIKAVENAIAKKNMNDGGNFNPTKCDINTDGTGNLLCGETELIIEIDGERPTDGFVEYNEGKLVATEIQFTDDSIVMNKVGNLVSLEDDIVCERADEETKGAGNVPSEGFKAGDAYICEVKEGVKYRFFVVSGNNKDGKIIEANAENKVIDSSNMISVNMIMERNIATNGTPTETPINIQWVSEEDYGCGVKGDRCSKNSKGPITGMNYIEKATSDWDNIPNIEMNYEKENNVYGSIKTVNNVTTITDFNGKPSVTYTNLKARLPYKETEVKEFDGTNGYLYDYLAGSISQTQMNGFNRYYLIDAAGNTVATVTKNGTYENIYPYTTGGGVRPVISVPLSDIY